MGVGGNEIPRPGTGRAAIYERVGRGGWGRLPSKQPAVLPPYKVINKTSFKQQSTPTPTPRPVPWPLRSLKTFGRMRDEMVFAALRCKRPKWLVFWDLMRGKRFVEEELFYAPDEVRLGAFCMLRGLRVCATGELFHAPGEARLRALGGRPFES